MILGTCPSHNNPSSPIGNRARTHGIRFRRTSVETGIPAAQEGEGGHEGVTVPVTVEEATEEGRCKWCRSRDLNPDELALTRP